MRRVNFSFGVMEPAVKGLPVTDLFTTARGEVGILQLLGIVEEERGVSGSNAIGHGLKFRYKLVKSNEGRLESAGPAGSIGATKLAIACCFHRK